MMPLLLNPDDWLGRHQGVCLLVVAALVVIGGSI
jgi:hypothetical protein